MYGAIIGDVVGSHYEVLEIRSENKKRSSIERRKILNRDVPLFTEMSSITDDTVLTVAVADAILNNVSYEDKIREYGLREKNLGVETYGRSRFGKGFIAWLTYENEGKSYCNGGAMRVSPVGYLFNDIEVVKEEAKKETITSHNHPESILCSQAVAITIYLIKQGYNKKQIKEYIEKNYFSLDFILDNLIENYSFDSKAINSIPQAIFVFLESNDFEDALRKAIAIGGDTDTIASIVGAISEAYYGIPSYILENIKLYIKDYMYPVIEDFYKKVDLKIIDKKVKSL